MDDDDDTGFGADMKTDEDGGAAPPVEDFLFFLLLETMASQTILVLAMETISGTITLRERTTRRETILVFLTAYLSRAGNWSLFSCSLNSGCVSFECLHNGYPLTCIFSSNLPLF